MNDFRQFHKLSRINEFLSWMLGVYLNRFPMHVVMAHRAWVRYETSNLLFLHEPRRRGICILKRLSTQKKPSTTNVAFQFKILQQTWINCTKIWFQNYKFHRIFSAIVVASSIYSFGVILFVVMIETCWTK